MSVDAAVVFSNVPMSSVFPVSVEPYTLVAKSVVAKSVEVVMVLPTVSAFETVRAGRLMVDALKVLAVMLVPKMA